MSIEHLEEKVLELQQRYFRAHNPEVRNQIINILQVYNEEIRTRRIMEAQRQRDEGNDDLDNLINVS